MRDKIIVKRYAQAYIEFAEPQIGMERCVEEMKGLKWLLRVEDDFASFLKAPEVNRQDKARVLDSILKSQYSEATILFINYLISRHRVGLLSEIADYVRLKYSHSELTDVTLRTTFPLELDIIVHIKESLEKRLQNKVNLYLELSPDLLGGVQVVIGNTVIDGSVRNRLFELKKKMLQSQVI